MSLTDVSLRARHESGGGSSSSGIKNTRRRIALPERFYPILGVIIGVAAWEIVSRVFSLAFLPPFSAVVVRLVKLFVDGSVPRDLATSLTNLVIGFAIAVVVGVIVGVAMGWVRSVEMALEPYIYAVLTSPTIVFAPIYFTIFGLSRWSIVSLIVHYATPVIIVNTCAGVKNVPIELVEMARVFGAGQLKVIQRIALHSALPLTMAGVRLGMARSVLGMINGELLIALVGLGATSSGFARAYDSEGVLAMVLLVIVVAFLCTNGVRLIDERLNYWLPRTHR